MFSNSRAYRKHTLNVDTTEHGDENELTDFLPTPTQI